MAVSIFKYARYFDPAKIGELKPSSSDVDNLLVIPGLSCGTVMEGLKSEQYMAIADGVSMQADKLLWWRVNCPVGLKLARLLCLFNHHQLPPKGFSLYFQTVLLIDSIFRGLHRNICNVAIQQIIFTHLIYYITLY